MDRRTFLSGASLAAATVATACGDTGQESAGAPASPAISRGIKQLRMVTTWPANFPGLGTAANNVAAFANAASGGTLDIRVYAAGELVSAFEVFDAVSEGTADMYHGAEYYWQGKSQAFNFFTIKGGFAEGTPDDLPRSRRAVYDESGRRSKVLVKGLDEPPLSR